MAAESSVIRLNVGGVHYDVGRTTLTQYSESMLARMINGKVPPTKVKGRYFIDRNGQLFGYILDFLRGGQKWIIPKDTELLQQILSEADFYCLDQLVQVIKSKLAELNQNLEHWKKYPLISLRMIIREGITQLGIYPDIFAKESGLQDVTIEIKGKFSYLSESLNDLTQELDRRNYQILNTSSHCINGTIVYSFHFRPKSTY